jgi:small nuclear ribonucleoprotein (snRNP)-like protein
MNSVARTKKEWLKDQIDRMETNEHSQIFQIIKKYTGDYTKTQSGVLVSTDTLNNKCLQEIEQYIQFSIDQKKRMDDDQKIRKNYERLLHD